MIILLMVNSLIINVILLLLVDIVLLVIVIVFSVRMICNFLVGFVKNDICFYGRFVL